ncbi:transposase family protein [Niveispirillum cyanobacteriorum]
MSACPGCGTRSGRIHSRYHRRLADLPTTGRRVELVLRARRFFCDVSISIEVWL